MHTYVISNHKEYSVKTPQRQSLSHPFQHKHCFILVTICVGKFLWALRYKLYVYLIVYGVVKVRIV